MKSRTTDVLRTVQLLGLSLWAGGTVFFSFAVAPNIFSSLEHELPVHPPPGWHWLSSESGRRLAGEIVGAIFPTYFCGQLIAGIVALATGCLLAWRGRPGRIRLALILVATAMVLVQLAFVLPHSTALLDESYRTQDLGDKITAEDLRKNFGMWHGISQTLNLGTILLVLATIVLVGIEKSDSQTSSSETVR